MIRFVCHICPWPSSPRTDWLREVARPIRLVLPGLRPAPSDLNGAACKRSNVMYAQTFRDSIAASALRFSRAREIAAKASVFPLRLYDTEQSWA
jgi:hypothetical protein